MKLKTAGIALGLSLLALTGWKLAEPNPTANPITANGAAEVTVLPFSILTSVEEFPAGWTHKFFWTTTPMTLSLETKDDIRAIRCATNGSASILSRSTDIEVGDYPVLAWDWRIDAPIESPIEEDTPEGDDHPARLLLEMKDRQGGEYAFEIIWSNRKFAPGDYKSINGVTSFVANGLNENTRIWQRQEVDLMNIYRDVTGRDDFPILTSIGILCDSDNTRTRSVAYFSDVVMQPR
ncbi:MAG: DUF3047 domain-containing protein [Rhodobacteraceae bacterium]|nr:DUF3047 domain-containing protein [Paracoccaceae bacterium]